VQEKKLYMERRKYIEELDEPESRKVENARGVQA
jgi:hypothetical protein